MKSRLTSSLLIAICAVLLAGPAEAGYRVQGKYGAVDIGGHLRSTNIVRHNSVDQFSFIMQRNTAKLQLEWKWLERGKAFGRNVGWLDRSDFFLKLRGVYDSIYDIKPGQNEREDFRGVALSPADVDIDSIDDRKLDRIKWQAEVREAYMDFYFKKAPLHLRIGLQQIVWGETDGIRMLDRANPLDLSWHFFQELPPPGFGFDELRLPVFAIKGLWDFANVGNLSQTFLEWYWNPGDWVPGKVSFLPRPWGVRLLDPIQNAAGTGVLQASAPNLCGRANASDPDPSKRGQCDSLMFGTSLLRQGNYKRNPLENSQFGVRFHFITEGGFEWSLNYLYQRFGPDGSPSALIRGVPVDKTFEVTRFGTRQTVDAQTFCEGLSRDPNNPLAAFQFPWAANQICLEAFAPYIHTVGASLNWFESEWTQTVWRMETIVDFGVPLYDGDKQVALFGFDEATGGGQPPIFPGVTNVNMWKGMIAFDRPTWIKWLNKKTTFFFTGQLFWHHIIDYKERKCAINDDPSQGFVHATSDTPNSLNLCGVSGGDFLLPGESWGFIGGLDLPNIQNPGRRLRDNVREWEVLFTLAVLGFYKGGTLVPAMIYLMDPINSLSQELAIGADWFVIPDLAINITTRLIWAGAPWDPYSGIDDRDVSSASGKGLIFDPWFLAGGSRGRSETSLQITYQF